MRDPAPAGTGGDVLGPPALDPAERDAIRSGFCLTCLIAPASV
jgi:hypothetical protein